MNTDPVLAVSLLMGALVMLRNVIVYWHGIRRIEEMHVLNVALIDAGSDPSHDYYAVNDAYFSHLLDLRKWTYRQFFPEIL